LKLPRPATKMPIALLQTIFDALYFYLYLTSVVNVRRAQKNRWRAVLVIAK